MKNLEELLHHQIKDLYSGENQILDALTRMIDSAEDSELKEALKSHRQETVEQCGKLEEIAAKLGIDPSGEHCKGMAGILAEGDSLVGEEAEEADVRDAAIITACQRVEHYEMAGYGSARTYARRLGKDDIANVLQEILDQEQDADEKLTRIAEGHVNKEAAA